MRHANVDAGGKVDVAHFKSLMDRDTILLVGSVQLVCLGIIGEYIGRIHDEVRARPLYLVGDVARKDVKNLETSPIREASTPRTEEPGPAPARPRSEQGG